MDGVDTSTLMALDQLTQQCGALITGAEERGGVWHLTTTPEHLHALLVRLRPQFTYPEDLTVVDEGEQFRLLYPVSYTHLTLPTIYSV